jgi:hypothetical protein
MTKTNLQTMKHVGKKMILGWTHQLKSTNCCSLCMSGRSCQNSNETIALPFPLLSTIVHYIVTVSFIGGGDNKVSRENF